MWMRSCRRPKEEEEEEEEEEKKIMMMKKGGNRAMALHQSLGQQINPLVAVPCKKWSLGKPISCRTIRGGNRLHRRFDPLPLSDGSVSSLSTSSASCSSRMMIPPAMSSLLS
jgi:hypothetical protein